MRCLWLCRTLPFPWTAGDRIYSAKLAGALAAAGADVTVVGFSVGTPPTAVPRVTWHVVQGEPRGRLAGLISRMPLVAARHATQSYRSVITSLANEGNWDAVIIDHYGMGWILAHRHLFAQRPPVFVFFTHDHEESVTNLQWRDRNASFASRTYMLQNHLKTRWLERRTARACNMVTAITPADAALFDARNASPRSIVLLPGYDGARVPCRKIADHLPRSILMFGSYRWSAKQANLRAFLDRADAALGAAGIRICILGDMPEDFRRSLAGRYRAADVIGYVETATSYLAAARLAVVAEPIGGGFKMKLLEYIFSRVPVAALDICASGMPDPVRQHMLLQADMDALARSIVAVIDDVSRLDGMQRCAFAAAERTFDWTDRGKTLHAAIVEAHGACPLNAYGDADTFDACSGPPSNAANRSASTRVNQASRQ